ncbi:MAG: bifunctional methylenetetrahydrofolate dehydrogenase/methenyltetrahydrofolate cyclohydrolase FolD [Brevinematia bacterium]
MKLIDGNLVASYYKENLKSLISSKGLKVTLAVVLVGDDPASKVYVANKTKECKEVGIETKDFYLPKDTSENNLINLLKNLNEDEEIDAILVQLPLPEHIDEFKIINTISPTKDVDGFHPENIGKLAIGKPFIEPCTPKGIVRLIDYYNIPIEGKRVVIVGRSNIVGKPASLMFLHRNATVTICHSKTQNIESITREADILVVAIGKPKFVKRNMVKEKSVVIDVGINRVDVNGKYKIVGDVDFDDVKEICSYITPVPGGVGPMTRAMLLENAYQLALYKKESCSRKI